MSLNTINRIHNKGDYRYEEHVAHELIAPGMLLEINSDNEVLAHNTSGAIAERLFALEDALQGNDIDHNYVAGELVCCLLGQRGTVVNALLELGAAYAVGDMLISNGLGSLHKGTSTDVIGVVEDEALDLSGSGAVDTRHPVRLL